MSNQSTQPTLSCHDDCSAAHLHAQRQRFLRKLADIARKAQKRPMTNDQRPMTRDR